MTSRDCPHSSRLKLYWDVSRIVRLDFGKIPRRLEAAISLLDALGEDSPLLNYQCKELIDTIHRRLDELYEEDNLHDIFALCPDL